MRVQSPELGRELFRVPQSGGDPTSQPIEMLLYLLPLFENIQLPEYLYFIYFWCKHTFFLKKKKRLLRFSFKWILPLPDCWCNGGLARLRHGVVAKNESFIELNHTLQSKTPKEGMCMHFCIKKSSSVELLP